MVTLKLLWQSCLISGLFVLLLLPQPAKGDVSSNNEISGIFIPPMPKTGNNPFGIVGVIIKPVSLESGSFKLPDDLNVKGAVKVEGFSFGNTSAEKAGVKTGDIFIQINNQPFENMAAYIATLRKADIGTRFEFTILRGSEILTPQIELMDPAQSIWEQANKGDTAAMRMLAEWLYAGNVFVKDEDASLFWLRKASANGDITATVQLATLLERKKKFAESYQLRKKAANAGSAQAWYDLGVNEDPDMSAGGDMLAAIANYKNAAEKGHAHAFYTLGRIFLTSHRVVSDKEQAFYYNQQAARLGVSSAVFNLAMMYLHERKDPQSSARLVLQSIAFGDDHGLQLLKNKPKIWPLRFRKQIQTTLKEKGLYQGKIDGRLGKKTSQALVTVKARQDITWFDVSQINQDHNRLRTFNEPLLSEQQKKLLAYDLQYLDKVSTHLNNQARYDEAIIWTRKFVDAAARQFGTGSLMHANAQMKLGHMGLFANKTNMAIENYENALPVYAKFYGDQSPDVAHIDLTLSKTYYRALQFEAAVDAARKALTKFEMAEGEGGEFAGSARTSLAVALHGAGRYKEAELYYKKNIEIGERHLGPSHGLVGARKINITTLYQALGRYDEAEKLLKEGLAIVERAYGRESSKTLTALNNLAVLYHKQGRFREALALNQKELEIRKAKPGPKPEYYASLLSNMGYHHLALNQHQKALALFHQALNWYQTESSVEHTTALSVMRDIGESNRRLGHYDEAEQYLQFSLQKLEARYGRDSIHIAKGLEKFGLLRLGQKRPKQAQKFFVRQKNIIQNIYGGVHPGVGAALGRMAKAELDQENWQSATDYWRQSINTAFLSKNLYEHQTVSGSDGENLSFQQRYKGFIKSLHAMFAPSGAHTLDTLDEGFIAAQSAQFSQVSSALARMSVRHSKDDHNLSEIIRLHQDKWLQRKSLQGNLDKARTLPLVRRDISTEESLIKTLAETDAELGRIEGQISEHFPDYAALVNPAPLKLTELQNHLQQDEAFIVFLDTPALGPLPEETFIWLVSREGASWVRSPLGTASLTKMVKRLRCGLDMAGWQKKNDQKSPCEALTESSFNHAAYYQGKASLPFEPALAHELYEGLFGEIKDKIKGKKLLLVPSGPLTSLPFQVLLTNKPKAGTKLQNMPWLIKDHALTVLPSVASLKALRRNAKVSAAKNPFIGFGNPLLTGPTGKDKSAWAKQACELMSKPKPKPVRIAGLTIPEAISKYFRGGKVDVALLRRQTPLPETADELCAVARTIGSNEQAVNLGGKATETAVKRLSEQGVLKEAKILHFATHGLLADETKALLKNRAEPSLLLTPPDEATEEDDGLLTASEISQLKLDADWVILSACNTAGGDKPGAEPMSGLAKAFFYAGARALLISHWSVNSDATVALITRSFKARQQSPEIGRAGALRTAMLSLINSKYMAHPEYWAPFIVVGEGK